MGSLDRKIRRMDEKQKIKYINDVKEEARKVAYVAVQKASDRAYSEGFKDATESATAKVIAVAAEVIYNDWRALSKKDTRIKTFVELLQERLEQIDNPSEAQQEVERILEEQCDMKFVRVEQEVN